MGTEAQTKTRMRYSLWGARNNYAGLPVAEAYFEDDRHNTWGVEILLNDPLLAVLFDDVVRALTAGRTARHRLLQHGAKADSFYAAPLDDLDRTAQDFGLFLTEA